MNYSVLNATISTTIIACTHTLLCVCVASITFLVRWWLVFWVLGCVFLKVQVDKSHKKRCQPRLGERRWTFISWAVRLSENWRDGFSWLRRKTQKLHIRLRDLHLPELWLSSSRDEGCDWCVQLPQITWLKLCWNQILLVPTGVISEAFPSWKALQCTEVSLS